MTTFHLVNILTLEGKGRGSLHNDECIFSSFHHISVSQRVLKIQTENQCNLSQLIQCSSHKSLLLAKLMQLTLSGCNVSHRPEDHFCTLHDTNTGFRSWWWRKPSLRWTLTRMGASLRQSLSRPASIIGFSHSFFCVHAFAVLLEEVVNSLKFH